MKKIFFVTAILVTSLVSGNLHAQAYSRCYSSGSNSNGGVEKIFIKLWIDAGNVEVSYRKYSTGASGTSFINMSKQGIIEGNKIVLANSGDKKENNTAGPGVNCIWFFQDDSLIVGVDVLQPVDCN